MKVIHPSIYESRRRADKKRARKKALPYIVLLFASAAYFVYAAYRPLPLIKADVHPIDFNAARADKPFDYPFSVGLYAEDLGTLAELDPIDKRSTASTIKVFTALMVLRNKPLKPGEAGEMITFTEADVDDYRVKVANGESAVSVSSGQQISEYDALQLVLVASANNIADKLAVWAYGSTDAYIAEAKKYASLKGYAGTTIADASGFSSLTKSTVVDMALIIKEASHNEVLAKIVRQQEITVGGQTFTNTNKLLGEDGIDGMKTGYTDDAGGCLLLTQERNLYGKKVKIYAAIMGAPDKAATFTTGRTILSRVDDFIELQTVISKMAIVGMYKAPWGAETEVVADGSMAILVVKGQEVFIQPTIEDVKPSRAGMVVGSLTKDSQKVNLVLRDDLSPPTLWWRITHPN